VHLRRLPCAKRLHRCFLPGEPAGEMHSGVAPPHAVSDLPLGEYALQEALAVALDRTCDTRDLRGIDTQPHNVRHRSDHTADSESAI